LENFEENFQEERYFEETLEKEDIVENATKEVVQEEDFEEGYFVEDENLEKEDVIENDVE
jgi:hypothetical protein